MPRMILLDETHVSVYVARSLPDGQCKAIRRILNSKRFKREFTLAIRDVFGRWPVLARARTTLTR